MSTPVTTLTLYRSPLVNDNVVMDSETFEGHLRSLDTFQVYNCTFQRQSREMRLPISMDVAGRYNYGSFVNNGRTYYCFITGLEYVNDNMTKATYIIDYWHTYQDDIVYKPTYVERSIIPKADDIIGQYVAPEPVASETFRIVDIDSSQPSFDPQSGTAGRWYYVMMDNGTQLQPNIVQHDYNHGGIENIGYAANTLVTYDLSQIVDRLNNMLTQNDTVDSVQGIWAVPVPPGGSIVDPDKPNDFTLQLDIPASPFGYTPKNNKVFTSPFSFVGLSSSDGGTLALDIQDIIASGSTTIQFDGMLSIIPTPQEFVCPVVFHGTLNLNKLGGITCDNFPTPNVGLNKVTVSSALGLVSSVIGTVASAAMGMGSMQTAAGSVANIAAAKNAGPGSMQAALGSQMTATASGLANSFESAVNLGQRLTHLHTIAGIKGSGNGALWSSYAIGITVTLNMPDLEELVAIDNFFSRYGYTINQIMAPQLHNRVFWDYVKTKDASFRIPCAEVEAENTINQMFDSGLTIWHSSHYFKDYSVNNN